MHLRFISLSILVLTPFFLFGQLKHVLTLKPSLNTDRISLVDINNDGIEDLFFDGLGWIPKNADGSLESLIPLSSEINFDGLVDFDNDGDLDWIFLDDWVFQGSSHLVWHENIGQGIYEERDRIYFGVDETESRLLADVDLDGLPDVIIVGRENNFGDEHLYWAKQKSDQTFEEVIEIDYLPKQNSNIVASQKIDNNNFIFYIQGDQNLEVIKVETSTQEFSIFQLNSGIENDFASSKEFVFFDFDLDQKMDILSIDDNTTLYRNIGPGQFEKRNSISNNYIRYSHQEDINGDGHPELFLRNGKYLDPVLNSSPENFKSLPDPIEVDSDVTIDLMYITELHNDNSLDLIFAHESGISVQKSFFEQPRDRNALSYASRTQNYSVLKDLDHNGSLELLGVDGEELFIIDYETYGDDFREAHIFYSYQEDQFINFTNLSSIDIDTDGDEDILCAGGSGGYSLIFINDGANNFSTPLKYYSFSASKNQLSDLNNDGILDAVYNRSTSNTNKLYVWLSQNGQLDYTLTTIDFPEDLRLSELIDLDNDSVSELIAKNIGSQSGFFSLDFTGSTFDIANPKFLMDISNSFYDYCLFEKNESTNNFEALRYKNTGNIIDYFIYNSSEEKFDSISQLNLNDVSPSCFQDVDNDGDLDVYLWDDESKTTSLAINTNAAFNTQNEVVNFPNGNNPIIIADDLNEDGFMDYHNYLGEFSIANSSDPTDFTFLSYQHFNTMREPNYLDLDNDGDLDNISIVRNEVLIRENFGDFQYSNIRSLFYNLDYYNSQNKHLPAFYDFNKDGLLDFIAPFLDGVSKFINTSTNNEISFDSTYIQDRRKNLVNFFIQELELAERDLLFGFNESSASIEIYAYDETAQDFIYQSDISLPGGLEIYQIASVFKYDIDNNSREEIYLNVTKTDFRTITLVLDSDWANLTNLNAEYLMNSESQITPFTVADIDDDGFNDLLASQYGDGSQEGLGVWFGPDYTDFPYGKQLLVPTVNSGHFDVLDFDQDGDLDLVLGTYWYEQADGSFLTRQKIPYIGLPLFTENIDDDDILEFFYPHYVYRYDVAANQALLPTNTNIYALANDLNDINTIDINQDGKGDLLVNFEEAGDFSKGEYLLYGHTGAMNKWDFYGPSQKDDLEMYADQMINDFDFNNDGVKDILQISYANLSIKLSNDIGGFDPTLPICGCETSPYSARNVFIEDIDGDGDLDILLKASNIYLLENLLETEQGFFTIHSRGNISASSNLHLQDLDSNGDFELVFIEYPNGGTPTLNSYSEISFSSSSLGVKNKLADLPGTGYLIDADSDGDLDLIEGPIYLNSTLQVTIFFNDGDYNFSGEASILTLDVKWSTWLDITGDAVLDLVVINDTNNEEEEFGAYPTLPNGKLGDFIPIEHPAGYDKKMIAKDLDNDLDQDIILHYQSKIHIFENLATSTKLIIESFIDDNQNGIWDTDEYPLGNCKYNMNPNSIFQFPNNFGQTIYSVNQGSYTVQGAPPSGWFATNGTNTHTVEIEDTDKTIQIGYYPDFEARAIEMHMVAGRQRCNSDAPLWFSIQNNGSSIETISNIYLKHDLKVVPLSATPQYNTAIGDSLTWDSNLIIYPQQKLTYYLTFQMPDETFTGEFNSYELIVESEQLGNNLRSSFEVNDAEVRCSFDPNDKLVSPNRSSLGWDSNETLFEETLVYTIRFQNTGNDTAYHVRITDQLDDFLDFESMNVLSSSHPVRTSLNPTGFITFNFPEIYLVDSLTNPIGSQGYVSFSIDPKSNLDENTTIANCAEIFFDFNPAIKTNEIESVMVSELSTSTINYTSFSVNVFPNPIKQGELFKVDIDKTPEKINIYHTSGKLVESYPSRNSMLYPTAKLTAGAYYIQFFIEGRSISIPFIVIAQ